MNIGRSVLSAVFVLSLVGCATNWKPPAYTAEQLRIAETESRSVIRTNKSTIDDKGVVKVLYLLVDLPTAPYLRLTNVSAPRPNADASKFTKVTIDNTSVLGRTLHIQRGISEITASLRPSRTMPGRYVLEPNIVDDLSLGGFKEIFNQVEVRRVDGELLAAPFVVNRFKMTVEMQWHEVCQNCNASAKPQTFDEPAILVAINRANNNKQEIASRDIAARQASYDEGVREVEEKNRREVAVAEQATMKAAKELESKQAVSKIPTECDRYAGDPEDPDKVVKGVAFEDMVVSNEHIIACKRSAQKMPWEGRFPYLASRLLLKRDGGKHSNAYRAEIYESARLKYTAALNDLGMINFDEGNYNSTVLGYFEQSGRNGSGLGYTQAARIKQIYASYRNTDQNDAQQLLSEAIEYLSLAIDAKHEPAYGYLALAYRTGHGVGKSESKALEILQQGARSKDPMSLVRLAQATEKGDLGLSVDKPEALKLYRSAQEQIASGRKSISKLVGIDAFTQIASSGVGRLVSAGTMPDKQAPSKDKWPSAAAGQLQSGSILCGELKYRKDATKAAERFEDPKLAARADTSSIYDYPECFTYNRDTFVKEVRYTDELGYLEVIPFYLPASVIDLHARNKYRSRFFVSEDSLIKR